MKKNLIIGKASLETLKAISVASFLAMAVIVIFDHTAVIRIAVFMSFSSNITMAFVHEYDWTRIKTYPNPFNNGAVARTAYTMVIMFIFIIVGIFHHIFM